MNTSFSFPSFTTFSAAQNIFAFKNFSAVPQLVSNTVRMHALETSFSFISLQFYIVSNTVRMHALDLHWFHLFLRVSTSFQISSECMF